MIQIDYRNARYQGQVDNLEPHGTGIALSEQMHFILSNWKNGVVDGKSLAFYGHGKYMYGDWAKGSPHGFNIYRCGDTVLFGHYTNGTITGQFLVIFQQQNLAVCVEMLNGSCNIVRKNENLRSREDVKNMVDQTKFPSSIPSQYYSLIDFIRGSFMDDARSGLKFEEDQANFFLGFSQGLGIVFTDDNYIKVIGSLNEKLQPKSLGGRYFQNICQEGNFQTEELIRYTKPLKSNDVRNIFRKTLVKSMNFLNGYLQLPHDKTPVNLDNILKQKLISQVAQQQLEDSIRYSPEELNDSLEYRPVTKADGDKIKKIRQQLYKSIRRPGSDLHTSPKKVYQAPPSPKESPFKENRYTPKRTVKIVYEPPAPIVIDRKELIQENKIQDYLAEKIRYENIQERRERILNGYKNLRTEPENTHFTSQQEHVHFAPSIHMKSEDVQESPGRKLKIDTERQQQYSSSRHYGPVLHERPTHMVHLNYSPSPIKYKMDTVERRHKQPATYKKIHMKTESIVVPERKPTRVQRTIEKPVERPIQRQSQKVPERQPRTAQNTEKALYRDKSVKKYKYLEGVQL